MFGLAVLVVFGVYLLISFLVVRWAISYARKNGKSAKRWGWGAAFIMYSLVFWDWIPTVATHQFYCAKDSGFWVYKTLDQWKAENPGVMEGLVSYNKNPGGFNVDWPFQYKLDDDGHSKTIINHINERFDELFIQQDVSDLLPIIRKENVLWDIKRGEAITRYVDFGTGNSVKNTIGPPGPLKFWLHNRGCIGGDVRQTKFGNFYIQFKGAEK
jgi:hypothetical protein